jgi:predicted membrane protein
LEKIKNMDFENKQEERRDWREERRRWKEERRKWHDEKRKKDTRGMAGIYTSGRPGGGHIWTGVFLLIIGGAALLKSMLFPIPAWLFTWQMLLIALGFFMGIRHNFRGAAWFILMLIGGVFLVNEFFPELMLRQYLWPAALILLGLFFIFKPRRHHRYVRGYINDKIETAMNKDESISSEDLIETTSIFGGVKKNIISKNFKGGDITNIMGGSEIDLTQADINGTATIDLTQIFGGTKLIVPSNWQVKTQIAAIFGGVEDKRSVQNTALDPNKILVLDGTSIFGGIEIRSY